ncbi:MAG: SDR family NAD(P)-dependent oxidoreductase [Chloroflexi bacterium]|nr:SDR family NAD(P)-dependent oxidoreductase [Chloroflexota bacterium]
MPVEGNLSGKVAVVTGAGSGIGRAIAIAYGEAGAAVSCLARTESDIAGTAADIRSGGGTAMSVQADVTDLDSVVDAFHATAGEFGGIDIVVINAGGNLDHSPNVECGSPAQWTGTVQLNLIGAYHTARAAIPHLKERGAGKIIAIGSGLGHRGRPGESAYASAKAGLSMLIRVLALEQWPHDISVNELVPGPVLTDRVAEYAREPGSVFQDESEWVKTPEDVAPLALFLATQPDKGPTGQMYSLMRRDA